MLTCSSFDVLGLLGGSKTCAATSRTSIQSPLIGQLQRTLATFVLAVLELVTANDAD